MIPFKLSARDRADLEDLVTRGTSEKERCRLQAILWRDDGRPSDEIAERLTVSRQTVYNWCKRFAARSGLDVRLRLADAPRRGRPQTQRGRVTPLIAQVVSAEPREFGFDSSTWSAALVCRYLADRHSIVVSSRTVGRVAASLGLRWGRPQKPTASGDERTHCGP